MLDSFHKYPLFPDLLENQRRSIKFFWEKGILDELELFSTIIGYKKEKTGTQTNSEQKTFKKKQNKGNNSLPELGEYSKRLRGEEVLGLGSSLQKTKNNNFPPSSGNGDRFLGTKISVSEKTLKKLSPQSGNLKNVVLKSSVLNAQTKGKFRLPIQSFEKSNTIFKKNPSLFSLVKKRLRRFNDGAENFTPPQSKDGFMGTPNDQNRIRFSYQNMARDPKTVLFQPLSTFFVSKNWSHQRNIKNKLKTKQRGDRGGKPPLALHRFLDSTVSVEGGWRGEIPAERSSSPTNQKTNTVAAVSHFTPSISTNYNPNLLTRSTSFLVRKKESILTLAGVSLPLRDKFGIWGSRGKKWGASPWKTSYKQNRRPEVQSLNTRGSEGFPPPRVNKQNDSEYLVLHGSKFLVKAPHYSQNQAIKFQKTYSVGLFLPVSRQNLSHEISGGNVPPHLGRSQNDSLLNTCSLSSSSSSGSLEKDKKEFWFYFGDIPLMTDRGSFIINGAPRVLVNQIIRCPSVYFKVKLDHKNRRTYIASFLSEYGSWLRLETDRLSNRLWARIDKSPRFPADLLLMGLGYNQTHFNKKRQESREEEELPRSRNASLLRLNNSFHKGEKTQIQSNFQKELHKRFPNLKTNTRAGVSRFSASLLKKKEVSTSSNAHKIEKVEEVERNSGLALQTIWKKCNPGRWTSSLGCYSFFYNKFLNPKRYSIGRVGRLRLNKRLLRNPECLVPTLTPEDILLAFNYLRQLRSADSIGNTKSTLELDDIDHLKNRRVRLPGEILQNQFRLALSRITYSALRFPTETSILTLKRGPEGGTPHEALEAKVIGFSIGENSAGGPEASVFRFVKTDSAVKSKNLCTPRRIEKPMYPRKSGLKEVMQGSEAQKLKSTGSPGQIRQPQRVGPSPLLKAKNLSTPPPIPAFQNTLRELFNTGQLSQYMDQTNPLAEITHKRRLSSLGPGGVGRDQAGFAVREIHPSHFGRICPIETPEGQNAGLVGSLASYARINTDGFLQSPGLPIEQNKPRFGGPSLKGRHKISLFSSELEDEIYVCTADTLNPIFANKTDWQGKNKENLTEGRGEVTPARLINSFQSQAEEGNPVTLPSFFPVRYKQEFLNLKGTDALDLTYGPTKLFTGICPIQLISIATSLIPFLEHDDANRALMGSNMQRQAVPFMITEKPFVGTGLELQAARDSSTILLAKQSGQVTFVDANIIQIQKGRAGVVANKNSANDMNKEEVFSYPLTTFVPSNQSTSLKQKPAVQLGDWVEKGFLLADGSATNDGEVTLGKNVLLAYMPWEGYNFEDAIVINERLVFEDIYTSIHVERFEVDVKNTKILSLRSGGGNPVQPTSGNEVLEQIPPVPAGLFSRLTPGEYLTSDLDILMLRFDGQQFTKNRSGTQKVDTAIGEDSESRAYADKSQAGYPPRPESLSHLDERGIVKPGAWVQEGDILVGKVQIGQKDTGGASVGSGSSSRAELPHEINQYIGAGYPLPNDKNGNLQSSARSLPFPEYRLLLAIFDLQNNRNSEGAKGIPPNPPTDLQHRLERKDYLLSAEKKLLENEINLSNGGFREKTEKSQFSGDSESVEATKMAPGFDGATRNEPGKIENSLFETGSLQTSQPIRNTSVKVGIGVKGRVLECVLDGELIKYKKAKENRAGGGFPSPLGEPLQREETSSSISGDTSLGVDKNILKESCSSVSIFLAHKKRIQLGDKMSGRHGNKGIVSLILPPQDMPYLQDGKAVDVVLNPLGVPSRMNVGQVLETLFGLSAFYYKKIYRIMPFDERINPVKNKENALKGEGPISLGGGSPKAETSRSLVYGHLKRLRIQVQQGIHIPQERLLDQGPYFEHTPLPISEKELTIAKGNQLNWLFDPNNPGKTQVFDGRTGEIFYQPVLVGYSYMFKLIHLVDDKIHARSTGPYSLVTQQPLGGRSKKGGQRLGEMEVWALQGFGTASILQEFLTVKSDEIYSRNHFLFHLMRRNWDSLEKIPALKRLDKELSLSRNQNLVPGGAAGVGGTPTTPGTWGTSDSLKHSGFNDTTASVHSKLPESFRVLINELHALCLSVYSNLPN